MSPAPLDASMRDASTAPRSAEGGGDGARVAGSSGVFGAWRRAVTPGVVLAAVLTGAVVASGRLPDGVAPWVMAGAGGGTLTALLGVFIKCRAVMSPPGSGGQAGAALQVALFGDFALQLFVVGIALIALFVADVKFPYLAGLALAFAGVALVFQLTSAMSLARSLRARAMAGQASGGAPEASGMGAGDAHPAAGSTSVQSPTR